MTARTYPDRCVVCGQGAPGIKTPDPTTPVTEAHTRAGHTMKTLAGPLVALVPVCSIACQRRLREPSTPE